MKCRTATSNDKKGIAKVLVASYNIDSEEEGIEVFESEVQKGHHYIIAVDENNEIAGIVTWLPHGLPKHGLAELDRIAVLPDFKGKGVAKHLFEALKKEAQAWYEENKFKLRKLYLLTHDDNDRAQGFYEKMGFKHETTLTKHYYDRVDERVYSIFF